MHTLYVIGKTYQTRGGDPVRILHILTTPGEEKPVVGLLSGKAGEEVYQWRADGGFLSRVDAASTLDLSPIEPFDYKALAEQLLAYALLDEARASSSDEAYAALTKAGWQPGTPIHDFAVRMRRDAIEAAKAAGLVQ